MRLKMAAFAPRPSASVIVTVNVRRGRLNSARQAYWMSFRTCTGLSYLTRRRVLYVREGRQVQGRIPDPGSRTTDPGTDHSCLSATNGSTPAARRAGM